MAVPPALGPSSLRVWRGTQAPPRRSRLLPLLPRAREWGWVTGTLPSFVAAAPVAPAHSCALLSADRRALLAAVRRRWALPVRYMLPGPPASTSIQEPAAAVWCFRGRQRFSGVGASLRPPLLRCCRRLLVVGRSSCPFCIEVSRTLTDMGLHFTYFQGERRRSDGVIGRQEGRHCPAGILRARVAPALPHTSPQGPSCLCGGNLCIPRGKEAAPVHSLFLATAPPRQHGRRLWFWDAACDSGTLLAVLGRCV